jgi:hypothetical protein
MMNGGVVPGGRAAQLHLADGGDLRYGAADIYVRLEKDLDDRDAVQRLRLDVLNVVDRGGHAALAVEYDAVDISCAERPVYCQTTVTTGMSIFGKISVGIDSMLKTPRIRIKSAKTAKV